LQALDCLFVCLLEHYSLSLVLQHQNSVALPIYWLPVEYRIKFELAKLTFNVRNNNSAPSYLSSLLSSYVPRPGLRSSNSSLLTIPSHKLNFASRGFRIAAPTIWNSLPSEIRTCASFCAFSGQLKTFYFNSAFSQS